jgi:dTDP-4-dehydrorhamnose reductase
MILLTGCGPIGSRLFESMKKDMNVIALCDKDEPQPPIGFKAYDISRSEEIASVVNEIKPAKIILTEEIPSVGYCEHNRMDAMEFNTRSVRFFAEAAARVNAKLAYISSAYVLDGRKEGGMYTEDDMINPINVYGETKLMGEVNVDRTPDFLVMRIGELYGDYDDNFVMVVYQSLSYGQKVELARDMYFSPVYVDDAAEAVKLLSLKGMSGRYNVAGPERISHYEFGLMIARTFGYSEDLIVPLSMDELGMEIKMPQDTSLDISKLSPLMKLRTCKEGLEAVKKSLMGT